jgi:hypothetical protein
LRRNVEDGRLTTGSNLSERTLRLEAISGRKHWPGKRTPAVLVSLLANAKRHYVEP